MERFGVDFYAEFAHALVAEGEALGGDAGRALAVAAEQLASGNGYVSLLRRARGIALARTGERDLAIGELELALAAARERGEEFDVALALDGLAALGSADTAAVRERDVILEGLGVVALPATPLTAPDGAEAQPLAGAASG